MAITRLISKEDEGQRLERWLKRKYPTLSYGMIQKWLRTGQIRLNGKRVKGSILITRGDLLRLPPQIELLQTPPPKVSVKPLLKTLDDLTQRIIYEDKDCCIINKPNGLAVQGGSSMKDYVDLYLKELCPQSLEPLRLTHRLDKDTSGVLLLAKTYPAAQYFTKLFKQGNIQKRYVAVVVGTPKKKQGMITTPIHKQSESPKESITEYRVLATGQQDLSLLELIPKTGRTHQLRIHCALSLECPILGDGKYGGKRALPFAKRMPMHLHAFEMIVPLPSGTSQCFTALIPKHMHQTLSEFFRDDIFAKIQPSLP